MASGWVCGAWELLGAAIGGPAGLLALACLLLYAYGARRYLRRQAAELEQQQRRSRDDLARAREAAGSIAQVLRRCVR